MKLRYTARAHRHIGAIYDYIERRNSDAATNVVARIRETAELLRDFPLMGHEGLISGTRELVVQGLPYVIVHRVLFGEQDVVEILAVFHGAQNRTRSVE
jgi:toxin ParE1/3/4